MAPPLIAVLTGWSPAVARAIAATLGSDRLRLATENHLGEVARFRGDYREAARAYRSAARLGVERLVVSRKVSNGSGPPFSCAPLRNGLTASTLSCAMSWSWVQ